MGAYSNPKTTVISHAQSYDNMFKQIAGGFETAARGYVVGAKKAQEEFEKRAEENKKIRIAADQASMDIQAKVSEMNPSGTTNIQEAFAPVLTKFNDLKQKQYKEGLTPEEMQWMGNVKGSIVKKIEGMIANHASQYGSYKEASEKAGEGGYYGGNDPKIALSYEAISNGAEQKIVIDPDTLATKIVVVDKEGEEIYAFSGAALERAQVDPKAGIFTTVPKSDYSKVNEMVFNSKDGTFKEGVVASDKTTYPTNSTFVVNKVMNIEKTRKTLPDVDMQLKAEAGGILQVDRDAIAFWNTVLQDKDNPDIWSDDKVLTEEQKNKFIEKYQNRWWEGQSKTFLEKGEKQNIKHYPVNKQLDALLNPSSGLNKLSIGNNTYSVQEETGKTPAKVVISASNKQKLTLDDVKAAMNDANNPDSDASQYNPSTNSFYLYKVDINEATGLPKVKDGKPVYVLDSNGNKIKNYSVWQAVTGNVSAVNL